jgi:hypothetical protein
MRNPSCNFKAGPRLSAARAGLAAATLLLAGAPAVHAQAPETEDAGLRAGKGFLETPVYTEAQDRELLDLFAGLRVADVTDGMDAAGLPNVGLMDPEIHPLWKDPEAYTHRFVGIAVTARYVPTQRAWAGRRPAEEYDAWVGQWYVRTWGRSARTTSWPGS